jgi:hypothetical protein
MGSPDHSDAVRKKSALWSGLGALVSRPWVAAALCAVALGLFAAEADFLRKRMRIKVEASDLIPKSHPKNAEFEEIRSTFQGSSRGFFIAVEAPVTRLRAVVPEVARAAEAALPDLAFVRFRLERDFFEEHLPLFQTKGDLARQVDYLEQHRGDLRRLVEGSGSLDAFLGALADTIDGEQELQAQTDERA